MVGSPLTDAPLKAGHITQREKRTTSFPVWSPVSCVTMPRTLVPLPCKRTVSNDLHWLSWPVSVFLRVCMVGIRGVMAKEARMVYLRERC